MPGIALKYWAFQQTGWGDIGTTVPTEPEESETVRSDYQDWKWVGVPQPLNDLESFKKSIFQVEPRVLTALQFFTYATTQYNLNFRTQERFQLASLDKSTLLCEHYSPSFTSNTLRDYFSATVGSPRERTNLSIPTHDSMPTFGYEQTEQIFLQWKTSQYQERTIRPYLPLSVSVELNEQHEHKTKSLLSLPWHIRTSILEYVRWRTPLIISLPNDMDDETLLAALAHIIIDLEENKQ